MAHMQKYTRAAVNNIIGHNDRTRIYDQRENIDPERSHLNKVYRPKEAEDLSPREYYDKRMSEVKCLNRQNVKTLCSWVITKPEGVQDSEKFFKAAFKFMAKRYGFKNVIAAFVHYDESTPHMHFDFIPVKDERVCAKEVVNRHDLQTFHKDLDQYMEREFGFNVGVVNGALKDRKNEDLETFKREEGKRISATLKAEIEGLEQTQRLYENNLQRLYSKIKKAQERIDKQNEIEKRNMSILSVLKSKLDNVNQELNQENYESAKEYLKMIQFGDGKSGYEHYREYLQELERESQETYDTKEELFWDDDEWEL